MQKKGKVCFVYFFIVSQRLLDGTNLLGNIFIAKCNCEYCITANQTTVSDIRQCAWHFSSGLIPSDLEAISYYSQKESKQRIAKSSERAIKRAGTERKNINS